MTMKVNVNVGEATYEYDKNKPIYQENNRNICKEVDINYIRSWRLNVNKLDNLTMNLKVTFTFGWVAANQKPIKYNGSRDCLSISHSLLPTSFSFSFQLFLQCRCLSVLRTVVSFILFFDLNVCACVRFSHCRCSQITHSSNYTCFHEISILFVIAIRSAIQTYT